MRVTQASSDERGISMVFTAIVLVMLLGVAAFTIDLGNGWVTRRNLVTSTDAAALAAAQEFATGGNGCATVDDQYVLLNNPTAFGITCTPGGSAEAGFVTVYAEDDVQTWFAQFLGQGDYTAASASTVQWGGPSSANGLRPFALCNTTQPDFQAWLALPDPKPTQVITITYGKDQPDNCGGAPGNWGVINFNGGNNPQGEINDWTANGYPGEVFAADDGGSCPDIHCYPGNPGAFNNPLSAPLGGLLSSGAEFQLPVFDQVTGTGSNAQFHFIYFVNVVLLDFELTGPQDDRYMTLEFRPGLVQGGCCDNSGPNSGVKVIAPCAIDNRDLGECAP